MYGVVNGLNKKQSPNITMNHLAAIAAVKVVNLTDDIITLNNAELHTYKTVVENNKSVKKTLPVVGNFKVGFDNDGNPIEFTAVSGNSNQVKIQLDEPVPVKPNASYTLYFAVSPFKTKLQDLTLYINGSEKIPVSADEVVFEAGKVTTLKLNIDEPEVYRRENGYFDALNLKWRDKISNDSTLIVSIYDGKIGECEPLGGYNSTAIINNEEVPIFKIGDDKPATIKIEGSLKEMVEALPLGFYASRWNDLPTAMRVSRIDAMLSKSHANGKKSELTERQTLNDKFRLHLGAAKVILALTGKYSLISQLEFSNGISYTQIENFGIGVSSLSFSGMIPNMGFGTPSGVLMIDEERTNKTMSNNAGENVETYLKKAGKEATFKGLYDILVPDYNADGTMTWSDEAKTTGNAIYNKVLAMMTSMLESKIGKLGGVTAKAAKAILESMYPSYTDLMYEMRDMVVTIEIETCPYPNTTTYNPIVFWGFNCVEPAN